MKKLVVPLLVAVMMLGYASAMAETVAMDKLTLEFVPSKDADVIVTANLPELLKAALPEQGYDVGEIGITVGTSCEAMAAGTVDVGWLPGGTYALYSDEADMILTATRAGLSNDSTDPATWNGDANKTEATDNRVTFYLSLIYATSSAYGKEPAAKVNAGEALTWEDLNAANWAVLNTSSSADYIYPTLWLMSNHDGKKLSDLSSVLTLAGYGESFDNNTVAITEANEAVYNPEFIAALQNALINVIGTPEGQEIFSVYSHTGYAIATGSDYDGARQALTVVQ